MGEADLTDIHGHLCRDKASTAVHFNRDVNMRTDHLDILQGWILSLNYITEHYNYKRCVDYRLYLFAISGIPGRD